MQRIVALVIFQNPIYAYMAELLVHSLRTRGRYGDEIRIFTDLDLSNFKILRKECSFVKIERHQGYRTKVQILSSIKCDQLLFLDCDCLVVGEINSVFSEDKLKYSTELCLVRANKQFNEGLSKYEIETYGNRLGINSGVYSCPGIMIKELARHWEAAFLSEFDQPALNSLIFRNILPNEPFGECKVVFPCVHETWRQGFLGPENRIYHLCGHISRQMQYELMKHIIINGIPVGQVPIEVAEDGKVALKLEKVV